MGRGYTFYGICKGTTKAGRPCRRIVVYANGYCRAHGGDSREFMRERLAKIKVKALRRHRKWRKVAALSTAKIRSSSMIYNPGTITIGGQTIDIPYIRDTDAGNYWDTEGALSAAGFTELKDPGLDWFRTAQAARR